MCAPDLSGQERFGIYWVAHQPLLGIYVRVNIVFAVTAWDLRLLCAERGGRDPSGDLPKAVQGMAVVWWR